MMDFELSEEHLAVQQAARDLLKRNYYRV